MISGETCTAVPYMTLHTYFGHGDKKESLLWHTRFLTHVLAAALARALARLVQSPSRVVLQL